jgi:hypothetical protein
VPDLDPGDPFVDGAAHVLPCAGLQVVRPPERLRRVEALLES